MSVAARGRGAVVVEWWCGTGKSMTAETMARRVGGFLVRCSGGGGVASGAAWTRRWRTN